MTPQQFIKKWRDSTLKERSASQSHFNDLCALLGEPSPTDVDPDGTWYTFERGAKKTGGGDGWPASLLLLRAFALAALFSSLSLHPHVATCILLN
jgi:hypothetical protein